MNSGTELSLLGNEQKLSDKSAANNNHTVAIAKPGYIKIGGDDRDVDNTDAINNMIKSTIRNGCVSACGVCAKCCQAIASCCSAFSEKALAVLGEVYPLLIRPVSNGIGGFFKGANGEYTIYRPLTNALMIPGNVAISVLDATLPVSPNGSCGIPLATIAGRTWNFFQLLTDKGEHRLGWKGPVAAVTGASLGMYAGLQTVALMNILMQYEHERVMYGPHPLNNMSANPVQIIKHLMESKPELWQKFVLGVLGYVSLTNGYIKGRDLVLHDVQNWWERLWSDVKTDYLQRHLNELTAMTQDKEASEQIEQRYYDAALAGKDWNLIDVSGRMLERLLLIPSSILSFAADNAQRITLPKAFLQNSGLQAAGEEKIRLGREKVRARLAEAKPNSCMAKLGSCLGIDKPSEYQSLLNEQKYPEYQAMLERKRQQYKLLAPSTVKSAVMGLFKGEGKSATEERLNQDLQQRYYQDVVNHNLKQAINPPVLPDDAPPPYVENWHNDALANQELTDMLHGKFPAHVPVQERFQYYQSVVYSVYSHQPMPSAPDLENNNSLGKSPNNN